MKNLIGIPAAILVGLAIGRFGVLVSVFADGSVSERLITIAVLLLIYFILGTLSGFIMPKTFWIMAFLLSSGGVYYLVRYMTHEFDIYYVVYTTLIIALPYIGALMGKNYWLRLNNLKNN